MRKHWDRHAAAWETHLPSTDLFDNLAKTVLRAVDPKPTDVAIDLGAGTGFLALQLAPRVARVIAVDNSDEMLRQLEEKPSPIPIEVSRQDLRHFRAPEAVDIIVSNYALHHLRNRGKVELLRVCHRSLRPGGRFAVADIMAPLTLRPGQNSAALHKMKLIASKGLPGIWRIAKNAFRWIIGRGEYPASPEFWMRALREAGFESVARSTFGNDSGVVWGVKSAGMTGIAPETPTPRGRSAPTP
jgi:ubiquinone/menaquinone biosynthesis C-methylase UbiE